MTTDEVIRSLLLAEPTLAQLVGQRVYPEQSPSNPLLPLVVYEMVGEEEFRTIAGDVYRIDRTYSMVSYAEDSGTAKRIIALAWKAVTASTGFEKPILNAVKADGSSSADAPNSGEDIGHYTATVTITVTVNPD